MRLRGSRRGQSCSPIWLVPISSLRDFQRDFESRGGSLNFFDIYFRISKNVDEQRVSIRFDKRCLKLIVILEDCPLSIIFAIRGERVEDKFAKCSTDITRFSWNHVKKKKSLKSAIINARWQEKEKRRLKRYRLKRRFTVERNGSGVVYAAIRVRAVTIIRRGLSLHVFEEV